MTVTRGRKILYTVGGVALLLLITECIGFRIPGLDIGLFLVIGWLIFLMRVLPQLHVRWDLVLSALAYAAAFTAGLHYFLRWLHREMRSGDAPVAIWRWRWTLSLVSLVLVLFAAGTAAVGVVHQTAWLARSPEPMYRRGSERAQRMRCASNLRQIWQGLKLYASQNGGRLPDDFRPLLTSGDLTAEVFLCPANMEVERAPGGTPEQIAEAILRREHCSYVYLGKGLTHSVTKTTVLVVEFPDNHDGDGVNVLYGDGSVEWLDWAKAEPLLLSVGFEKVSSR